MVNGLYFVVFVLSLQTFAIADKPCGEQITDFLACFEVQRKEQDASKPQPITFDDFQKRISSCFTNNGCKAIKLESEDNIQKRHNAPPGVFFYDKVQSCSHKTAELARPNVEKCVAKTFPGFVLPPPPPPRKEGVGPPITISWAAQAFIELRSNDTCPASSNTAAVEKCLDAVFQDVDKVRGNPNPFEKLVEFESRVNRFCKANCFSKISDSCQKSLNESFPTICNCVVSDFAANVDKYDDSYKSCIGDDAAKATDYKKNVTISIVRQKLHDDLCDELPDNPCAQGKTFVDSLKKAKAQGGSGKQRR